MSEYVTKVSLILELPELKEKSMNELLGFFRTKCGEPSYVDSYEEDGVEIVDYFEFDTFIKPYLSVDGRIFVEIIFEEGSSINFEDLTVSLHKIQASAHLLTTLFNKKIEDCHFCVKNWYNGTDEPSPNIENGD